MKECVFCSKKEIKDRLIVENNTAWAFPTNIPITSGHTLISPKRCVASLIDLSNEERKDIFLLADSVINALKKSFHAEGFNIAWNEGVLAGQSVPHFHLHIIPRHTDDTGVLGYDPRSMIYRTGDREPISESDLIKITDKIKENI